MKLKGLIFVGNLYFIMPFIKLEFNINSKLEFNINSRLYYNIPFKHFAIIDVNFPVQHKISTTQNECNDLVSVLMRGIHPPENIGNGIFRGVNTSHHGSGTLLAESDFSILWWESGITHFIGYNRVV